MPLTWTISDADRLVSARAEGAITLKEIESMFDEIVVRNALGYRKLFDSRGSTGTYDDKDVMSLGARIQAYVGLDKLTGAAAIVVEGPKQYNVAVRFANIAKGRRPIQVFYTLEEARAWLDTDPKLSESVI